MEYFNRYQQFLVDGEQTVLPYVTLPRKSTDVKYIYRAQQTRLDKISQEYYNSPYFGWLIMLANPNYVGGEWNIPDGTILTIPYPLITSLQDYKSELNNYFFYYGR